jgi:hypothetical protein
MAVRGDDGVDASERDSPVGLSSCSPGSQNESYGDKVARTKEATEKINSFWKGKRTAKEMDEVYSQLLRSGKGAVSRHHELSGALAEAESKQNPKFAHMQAILAAPEGAGAVAGPMLEPGRTLASPAAEETAAPASKLVVDVAALPTAPPR